MQRETGEYVGLRRAAAAARTGNKILSLIAAAMILVMLLYGGYSLWDTMMLYKNAFADSELMKYKPSNG